MGDFAKEGVDMQTSLLRLVPEHPFLVSCIKTSEGLVPPHPLGSVHSSRPCVQCTSREDRDGVIRCCLTAPPAVCCYAATALAAVFTENEPTFKLEGDENTTIFSMHDMSEISLGADLRSRPTCSGSDLHDQTLPEHSHTAHTNEGAVTNEQ